MSRIVKLVALGPEAEAGGGGGGGGGGEEFDYAEVRREAHSMKGAASTIGAMQLSQARLRAAAHPSPNPIPNPIPNPSPNPSPNPGLSPNPNLHQAALELQLTAERLSAAAVVRQHVEIVSRHFESVRQELGDVVREVDP